ncbi:MAG: CoA transferase, partial [Alphaproteobacteria bacterium]|nr:CoA transferase [Alphaproteobacteria bacterium]
LIGDGGGGALYLLAGILAALWERSCSGQGQVVDAAMVDGTVSMMAMLSGLLPAGSLSLARESNLLGGAAPFYRCYRCADGLEIAFGALEPQFFKAAVEKLGLGHLIARQYDQRAWPEMTRTFAQLFATQPRDHWAALFRGSDACITPVLTYQESLTDPHLRARATYADIDGTLQPAPAPRFSRTPGTVAAALDADIMIESWCAQKAGG